MKKIWVKKRLQVTHPRRGGRVGVRGRGRGRKPQWGAQEASGRAQGPRGEATPGCPVGISGERAWPSVDPWGSRHLPQCVCWGGGRTRQNVTFQVCVCVCEGGGRHWLCALSSAGTAARKRGAQVVAGERACGRGVQRPTVAKRWRTSPLSPATGKAEMERGPCQLSPPPSPEPGGHGC